MATLRINQTIGASSTVENLIAGRKFEFPEQNSVVSIYACEDVTVAAQVEMDITFGNVIAGDAVQLPDFTVDQGPDRDKHLITRFVCRAGQRIQLKCRETAGVNMPIRVLIDFQEIL